MRIKQQVKIDEYYKALVQRDANYLGLFFVGVKTTFIFCISTCRARKPKKENVEFFSNAKDALENGYRPCKICQPTKHTDQPPIEVDKAIQLVTQSPKEKITDFDLKTKGISPSLVRRWFKKHYGITFQAYQRMYRMNVAYEELKKGKSATNTAFHMGYESLSGFGYTFKKLTGKSPVNSATQSVILINRLTTPIGAMFICATNDGICLLEFTNRKMLETEFKDLQKRLNAVILFGENEHIRQAKQELKEYFNGSRQLFDVTLHPVGTDFQKQVWKQLVKIQYGETTSYMNQAKAMKKEKAIRAIASANGYNKISILIPCHRVIGSDGKLTGYGGGIERKRWLINHELEHSGKPRRTLF